MADHVPTSTADLLKQFSKDVSSPSTKERSNIVDKVRQCVKEKDLPDQALKGILKFLYPTIVLYRDRNSLRSALKLVEAVVAKNPVIGVKNVAGFLNGFARTQKELVNPSRTSGGDALMALTWTCIALIIGFKNKCDGDDLKKLVELQAAFVYGALAADNAAINKAVYRKLAAVWKCTDDAVDQYAELIQKTELSYHSVCLLSALIKHVDNSRQDKLKDAFIDIYLKQVLGSRTKPPLVVLKCSQQLLRHCSHQGFRDNLWPFTQKALLRNPEIILEAFGWMLRSLQLDLSQYGMDIIKPLAAQLISKDQGTRDDACEAVGNLATQCSDQEVIRKMVKHLFDVLNGSEGKLTLVEQKMSVLRAVGNMRNNTVSGASTLQDLSTTVVEWFLPLLSTEVHEQTLVVALSMMTKWCSKFYTSVPAKLMDWFKKAVALKSFTSPVRNSYILCMGATFHNDTLPQAMEMLPFLIQTVEKAANQAIQVALVTEGVSAANILTKLALVDINSESKLANFWNIVLDADKQLFVNEKYLSSLSEEGLQGVVTLAEKLILEYPQKMTEKVSKPYYRAIVYSLTHKSYNVRKFTTATVKKILSLLGGAAISVALLEGLDDLLLTQKVVDLENLNTDDTDRDSVLDGLKYISPRILAYAVVCLTAVQKPSPKDAEAVAKASLLTAHHPCIVSFNNGAWTDVLFQLGLDARKFIMQYPDFCVGVSDPNTNCQMNESQLNSVQTLVRICPEVMMPALVTRVTGLLGNPDFLVVTRDEFGAYQYHEGELYDKQLAASFKMNVVEDKNIRRENKLYSYKEQLAEMELKKELAKKKGKSLEPEVKLTKKQEEALQQQLQKESEIRARLTKLNEKLCQGCQLLEALLKGNPDWLGHYMREVCRVLVPLFKSPLGASPATEAFVNLATTTFIDPRFGTLLTRATIRLMKPECACDKQWSEEPQLKQSTRIINRLVTDSGLAAHGTYSDGEDEPEDNLFSASNFVLIFYFLNCVLGSNGVAIGSDDSLMVKALGFIEQHARMRQDPEATDRKFDPSLLPVKELLATLLCVISVSVTRVQQAANAALVEVAKCVSGETGCATITHDEILVLLEALKSTCTASRESVLQALLCVSSKLPNIDDNYEMGLQIGLRLWVASHDVEPDIRHLADSLRETLGLDEPFEDMCCPLVDDIIHPEEIVRSAAAETLAKTLQCHRSYITATIDQLLASYEKKLEMPPPLLDEFGRMVGEPAQDEWPARCGIAMALGQVAPILPDDQLLPLFHFFVPRGLGDRNQDVRTNMRTAALAVINVHGKHTVSDLLPVFEEFLTNAPGTAGYDAVRQSIVILMGSLAKHLDKDNPKVKPIVGQLISALSTPSQEVQEAVANCLPPLVSFIKSDASELVLQLMNLLLESENYGERKGAAYGLAGLVRGLGITSLKQMDIMTTLEEAVKDKKNPRRREGALFAYEKMCSMMGKLFEPYVVHILPHLLLCFGDNSQYVREAADETAKAVMSMLTAHGVKLVLPSLLKGLEEDSWRTKAGAVELLGSMAYCAPKQLSACLPSIVPKLTEVLTDSHVRVQKAGGQALKQIGSVIKNPEIQAIVPVLLEALQDPAKKTCTSLQNLLETKFVHFIDAPSLALIMPVVERAFQDRATETRKMAAQIIGNMYSLTDQKDLDPYIDKVIPGLKQSLLDPVPEVRTVSARALGAMVKGMGGDKFNELMNWLMEMLKSEGSSVDRSGAAQGLSEVMGGMGLADLHKLMPTLIATAQRTDIPPHVRDGYIMMFIYLPSVFKEEFKQYIAPIIPPILKALADESEFVRDTALKAGQRIINAYANTAIELLLPELEQGLFDDNWRIRYSSVQLLGDLLYTISGVSGKMSTESAGEDDNFGTETSQQIILKLLGMERRNRVLSGLYMGRSDTALLVRQAALHVWKVIVSNTPRTLREILSTLFSLLLGCLASTSHDKRQVAARTLGDLVRKLGDRVLPEIIPILEKGLESEHGDQRQGVCIGLSEIMASTQRDHVIVYAESLIPTVRRALIDPLPEVRQAAANTFDSLHSNIGARALDEILPNLLNHLGGEGDMSERALDGLTQVMVVKSRIVLPYLVPQLTTPPVNTKALSYLASVSGEALTKHLPRILPALMSSLSEKAGSPEEAQELEYCRNVVLSVEDEVGVRTIMEELLNAARSDEPATCRASVNILQSFCENTKVDFSEFLPQLYRGLIGLFVRPEQEVLLASWECLNAITKKLSPTDMLLYIQPVRQAIKFAVQDMGGDQELPGLSIPKKGIAPLLPIFREGILGGSQDVKEYAAISLGELIKYTSAEALKPSVVNITGPLIRILGDRYVWSVKTSLLETLTLLLSKVGAMLKPFLPQLQTTFVKALYDPNRSVRLKAAAALGKLIVIHTRVDPLFTELQTGFKGCDDTSVKDTFLQALRFCLEGAGSKMTAITRKQIMPSLIELMGCQEDSTRMVASACVGVTSAFLPEEELTDLLVSHLLDTNVSLDWTLRHGRAIALGVSLKQAPEKVWDEKYQKGVRKALASLTEADRIPLCLTGFRCLGHLLRHLMLTNSVGVDHLQTLIKGMKHDSNDVKQLSGQIASYFVQGTDTPLDPAILKVLVPTLVMGTKEKNTLVRTNSEFALISLLHLRMGESFLKTVLPTLDSGMQDSLQEVLKSLRKQISQPEPPNDIDDTVLI